MRIKGAEEWGYKELLKYCIFPLALISITLLGTKELKPAVFWHLNAASCSSWFSSLTQPVYALLSALKCHKHAAVGQGEQSPIQEWYRPKIQWLCHILTTDPTMKFRVQAPIQCYSADRFILALFWQLFCSLQLSWTCVGKKVCGRCHTLVGISVIQLLFI